MISFTIRGKNFPPGASYWWPGVYYYENAAAKSFYLPAKIPIDQTAHFTNVPINAGFWVGILDAEGESITGPYAFAATDLFVLENGGQYILDFHQEVGVPTLTEEAPTMPVTIIGTIALLLPHWPWIGPPVPSFLPPWPWYKG